MSVQVIAEAGINHNGSLERAVAMVDAAAAAGADVVKFQTFRTSELVAPHARKAKYQAETTGGGESQFDMLRKVELDEAAHRTLLDRCRQQGIAFMSTPFDLPSLDLLLGLDVPVLKIPSGEITNGPLLRAAAASGRRLILSTGMANLDEIQAALDLMAFAVQQPDKTPCRAALASADLTPGHAQLRQRLVLLHCTSAYPTPYAEVNLRAMATMTQRFGLPVGLSDHSQGIAIPIAAAALGAVVVEKHFTLDRSLPGPDHPASLEPDELAAMVAGIRAVSAALGDGVKQPRAIEADTAEIARKSLVASRAIAMGEAFDVANLAVKRPGTGRSPMEYWDLLGQVADRDYQSDEVIG